MACRQIFLERPVRKGINFLPSLDQQSRPVLQEPDQFSRVDAVLFAAQIQQGFDPDIIWNYEIGLKKIFAGFKKVMTIEINYSDELTDPYINEENRRRGQLSWLLRASTLVDVDCWTRVPGEPLQPGKILQAIRDKLPNGDKA